MSIIFVTNSVITVPPFSCILAPHSAILVMPAAIACGISVGSSASFPMIVVTSCPAADKILGSPVINPVTIAAIICGIASISRGIASIMPSISATMMSPALSKISGIPSTSASTIAVMISGNASIRTGSAATIPCASPVISCNAASISRGKFSINVSTIFATTLTIVGSNVGNACPIPFARLMSICIPACKICGSNFISMVAMLVITFVIVGNNVGSASMIPCASASIIAGALSSTASAICVTTSKICGIASVMLPIIPVTPSLISCPASSCPAIRSLNPFSTSVSDGSISPVMEFFTPVNVLCNLVCASQKAALAATASSDMSIPYFSHSSFAAFVSSLDIFSSAAISVADFPSKSVAALVRSAPSPISCNADMTSSSCCSCDFPFKSSMDKPTAFNFSFAVSLPLAASVITPLKVFMPPCSFVTSVPQS